MNKILANSLHNAMLHRFAERGHTTHPVKAGGNNMDKIFQMAAQRFLQRHAVSKSEAPKKDGADQKNV